MASDDDVEVAPVRQSDSDDDGSDLDALERGADSGQSALEGEVARGAPPNEAATDPASDEDTTDGPRVAVGEYTWAHFLDEYGEPGDVESLYGGVDPRDLPEEPSSSRWDDSEEEPVEPSTPTREDWEEVSVDSEEYLDFHAVETEEKVGECASEAHRIQAEFEAFCDPETTPVVKDVWMWEHYKREYYYEDDGARPRDDEGDIVRFDAEDALGFDPEYTENALARAGQRADELADVVEERTVDVNEELDEDAFFSDERGATTVVNRYDLEKAVPMEKKTHFQEVERYWVNKPHSFIVIFQSIKENEKKYYQIEPYQNRIEADLTEFLTGKLRTAIKYDDESSVGVGEGTRRRVIERQALDLLDRYDVYERPDDGYSDLLSLAPEPSETDDAEEAGPGAVEALLSRFGIDSDGGDADDASASGADAGPTDSSLGSFARRLGLNEGAFGGRLDGLFASPPEAESPSLDGIAARPESAVLADNAETLTEYQVEKMLYFLRRDFIGYERIDGIKHDINVEDISCDGYNSPVFVYHSDYEQIISNVYHGETELDDFVVKLAQRSGKGISKRRPQVDATLPDGSRAQLTLGREVSDHGTNYTIRQFKDVPFTPIDLINWNTFSLDEMAFLWLCIENNKSLIFAGGTASGKTTSLNAVSLFIPSNSKIVSIEDTREVELPQRNWIASVTRPSFSDDDKGDVDEFDLLEAALRQRPDYIVMGEIRGEEGRTLFQVMSTGHTTYTTFHADSVGEVLKRFTTEPINVSKTMFTALDLVSIQTSTRVQGNKVRRNKSLTEINHYDPENDEINVQDVFQWQAETDEYLKMGSSNTLEEIKFDRGWSQETLELQLFKRQVVLAYLIKHGLNTYTQVAATLQAYINDPDTILALMANDELERSLEDLREMESVQINVDPDKEEMVPRPDPSEEILDLCERILRRAEEELFPDFRGQEPGDVADALTHLRDQPDVTADTDGDRHELDALDERTTDPELDEGGDGPPGLDEGEDGPSELDEGEDEPSELDGGSTPALDAGDDAAEAGESASDGADGEDADGESDADGASDPATATDDAPTEPDDAPTEPNGTSTEAGDPASEAADADNGDEPDAPSDGAWTEDEEFGIEDILNQEVDTAELADDADGWGFGEFESVEPEADDSDASDEATGEGD
ncbi:type II/IV secretion system ATPase subunit [Halopelagius longus]|uniref:Flagellar protein FlaI n=1 Tax=Halopelagius longus TaxID=1236180 RepID=A0A1H1BJR7_9EURY|nr:type II/IV secretion system ATPase subunit [Halopelagius longus]RDI70815.1 secretion system protein E [Halopelagius longus]SDQ52225.1 flagellar protein FlaI [Halopelagius longus]